VTVFACTSQHNREDDCLRILLFVVHSALTSSSNLGAPATFQVRTDAAVCAGYGLKLRPVSILHVTRRASPNF